MLEGVRILIDRMESSPEEFVVDPHSMHLQTTPKFHFVARALEEALYGEANPTAFIHLTAEERTALLIAYRKMMRQAFTAQVIARTFAEKDENDTRDKVYSVPMGSYGKAVAKHPGAPVAYFGAEAVESKTTYAQINPWK